MKKTERLVFFYDLYVVATSRTFDAPRTISVRQAFDLMELVPIPKRQKSSAKATELLYVADWARVGNVINILVNKSDKAISDPVFTVPQEGKRRTAEKEDEEGQDFSVHIVVKLPLSDLDPALVIVEHCTGLGVPFIQRLLNEILRNAKNISPELYEQNHPDGALDVNEKPKKINVKFKFEFNGHLSNDLKNDLDSGKIRSIELITERTKHTVFDGDGYITEKCKSIVLSMKNTEYQIFDKFDRIMGLLDRNKNDYSSARIKFKTIEGIDRTVDMQISDCFAEGYVLKAKLEEFNGELSSSYEKFDDQIITKMKKLIQPEV